MKLNVDFNDLWKNVNRMGADRVEIDLELSWTDPDIEFDTLLSTAGIEIDLTEVEALDGLLNYRGRQVLLFIPDHSFRLEDILARPETGNKFHIADCNKLEEMRAKNRFERYKVTNNISGVFDIFGTPKTTQITEGKARLNVCKLCLNKLNYKGASNENVQGRNNIVDEFGLDEFFSTYSSLFKYYPKTDIRDVKKGYSKDWDVVSLKVRKDVNYCCSNCNVSLVDHKKLLHTHHLNGEKGDDSPSNLIPLCADCHRKQPFHGHMQVKHEVVKTINHLRREQNLLESNKWEDIYKYADPSCHGVLSHCQKNGYSYPEVGYEVTDDVGQVIAEFELAWTNRKVAVVLGESNPVEGWKIFGLGEAVQYFDRKLKR
jgi:hypothetical protein